MMATFVALVVCPAADAGEVQRGAVTTKNTVLAVRSVAWFHQVAVDFDGLLPGGSSIPSEPTVRWDMGPDARTSLVNLATAVNEAQDRYRYRVLDLPSGLLFELYEVNDGSGWVAMPPLLDLDLGLDATDRPLDASAAFSEFSERTGARVGFLPHHDASLFIPLQGATRIRDVLELLASPGAGWEVARTGPEERPAQVFFGWQIDPDHTRLFTAPRVFPDGVTRPGDSGPTDLGVYARGVAAIRAFEDAVLGRMLATGQTFESADGLGSAIVAELTPADEAEIRRLGASTDAHHFALRMSEHWMSPMAVPADRPSWRGLWGPGRVAAQEVWEREQAAATVTNP